MAVLYGNKPESRQSDKIGDETIMTALFSQKPFIPVFNCDIADPAVFRPGKPDSIGKNLVTAFFIV